MSTIATRARVVPISMTRFRAEVLAAYAPPKAKATLTKMRRALDTLDELGVKTTANLTPALLDRVVSLGEGKSFFQRLWNIHATCELAIKWGYLKASPFRGRPDLLREMRASQSRIRRPGPSPTQMKQVLAHLASRRKSSTLSHRLYVTAALIAYTGLQVGEVASLRVTDVDLEESVIRLTTWRGTRLIWINDRLARVLKEWLFERRDGGSKKYVLNGAKVAEARRLKSEGWSFSDLRERYGAKTSTLRQALSGVSWRSIPEEGIPLSIVGDSEWLLPNLDAAYSGQCKSINKYQFAYPQLKVAGRTAGIDNLTFRDLHLFHRNCIKPDIAMERPGGRPVITFGESHRVHPTVDGVEMPCPSEAVFEVLTVLKKHEPYGVELPRLEKLSRHRQPDVLLRKFVRKHPCWGKYIQNPGVKGKGGIRLGLE